MNAIWLLCGAVLVGVGYNFGAVIVRAAVVNYYEWKQRKNARAINQLVQATQTVIQFPDLPEPGTNRPKGDN